ncbi:MAG: hypothetical protein WD065_17320 [Planctomycetaceae bacterium]
MSSISDTTPFAAPFFALNGGQMTRKTSVFIDFRAFALIFSPFCTFVRAGARDRSRSHDGGMSCDTRSARSLHAILRCDAHFCAFLCIFAGRVFKRLVSRETGVGCWEMEGATKLPNA